MPELRDSWIGGIGRQRPAKRYNSWVPVVYGFSSNHRSSCHRRAPLLRTKGAKFLMCRQGSAGTVVPLLLSCPPGFTVHRHPRFRRFISPFADWRFHLAVAAIRCCAEIRPRCRRNRIRSRARNRAPRSGRRPLTGCDSGKENRHGPSGISCHWA